MSTTDFFKNQVYKQEQYTKRFDKLIFSKKNFKCQDKRSLAIFKKINDDIQSVYVKYQEDQSEKLERQQNIQQIEKTQRIKSDFTRQPTIKIQSQNLKFQKKYQSIQSEIWQEGQNLFNTQNEMNQQVTQRLSILHKSKKHSFKYKKKQEILNKLRQCCKNILNYKQMQDQMNEIHEINELLQMNEQEAEFKSEHIYSKIVDSINNNKKFSPVRKSRMQHILRVQLLPYIKLLKRTDQLRLQNMKIKQKRQDTIKSRWHDYQQQKEIQMVHEKLQEQRKKRQMDLNNLKLQQQNQQNNSNLQSQLSSKKASQIMNQDIQQNVQDKIQNQFWRELQLSNEDHHNLMIEKIPKSQSSNLNFQDNFQLYSQQSQQLPQRISKKNYSKKLRDQISQFRKISHKSRNQSEHIDTTDLDKIIDVFLFIYLFIIFMVFQFQRVGNQIGYRITNRPKFKSSHEDSSNLNQNDKKIKISDLSSQIFQPDHIFPFQEQYQNLYKNCLDYNLVDMKPFYQETQSIFKNLKQKDVQKEEHENIKRAIMRK